MLAPTLRSGDTVVTDNSGVPKVTSALEATDARLASLRYLSPHGPNLNPIGFGSGKLERLPRNAAARTAHALDAFITGAHRHFALAEWANHLLHFSYPQSAR